MPLVMSSWIGELALVTFASLSVPSPVSSATGASLETPVPPVDQRLLELATSTLRLAPWQVEVRRRPDLEAELESTWLGGQLQLHSAREREWSLADAPRGPDGIADVKVLMGGRSDELFLAADRSTGEVRVLQALFDPVETDRFLEWLSARARRTGLDWSGPTEPWEALRLLMSMSDDEGLDPVVEHRSVLREALRDGYKRRAPFAAQAADQAWPRWYRRHRPLLRQVRPPRFTETDDGWEVRFFLRAHGRVAKKTWFLGRSGEVSEVRSELLTEPFGAEQR
ncbi:MAG: hypothetical protein AAF533_19555 [Acidobacteriota bacterium]